MLTFILTPFFLTPLIITLLSPWNLAWRVWSVITASMLVFLITSPDAHDKGFGYLLGVMILTVFAAVAATLLFVKYLLFNRRRKRNPEIIPKKSMVLQKFDYFLSAFLGLATSCIAVYYLCYLFEGVAHGYIIHIVIAILAYLCVIAANRYFSKAMLPNIKCRSIFVLALCLPIMFVAIAGLFFSYAVLTVAKQVAEQNDFCIALDETKPASPEDMTFFTMPKNNYNRHAVVLVEKYKKIDQYYWSYRLFEFIPFNDVAPIGCKPHKDFENVFHHSDDYADIRPYYMNKHFLEIPSKYSASVSRDYISIAAVAPDFHEVERRKHYLYTSVELRSRSWFDGLKDIKLSETEVNFSGTWSEFDRLKKEYDQYFIYDADGLLLSVINCFGSRCQHRFYRNNAMFTFDHSPTMLPRSAEMENNLFRLFESFGLKNM